MIITLGGKAGSGKGTIAKLLADKIDYQIIGIGAMKRQLAEEMGLSISEFNQLGKKPENQKSFDLKYEEFQKKLNFQEKIILDSRLGFLCQPQAFKIFLDIQNEIAAERIWKDNRNTDNFKSLTEALEATKLRNEEDRQRFIAIYNVDIFDYKHYDLVIDTSDLLPEEVLQRIIQHLMNHQKSITK